MHFSHNETLGVRGRGTLILAIRAKFSVTFKEGSKDCTIMAALAETSKDRLVWHYGRLLHWILNPKKTSFLKHILTRAFSITNSLSNLLWYYYMPAKYCRSAVYKRKKKLVIFTLYFCIMKKYFEECFLRVVFVFDIKYYIK